MTGFKLKTVITPETIRDLMTTAIESGDPVTCAARGGWCAGIMRVDGAAPPEGEHWYYQPRFWAGKFTIRVHEVDDETTGHITKHSIRRRHIEDGLTLLANKYPEILSNIVNNNHDANDADIFLQCVCFKEVRYQ